MIDNETDEIIEEIFGFSFTEAAKKSRRINGKKGIHF